MDAGSRRRLARDLFDFLEEEVDPGVRSFVEQWPTKLPATHPTSEDGRVELPDDWQERLDADGEYQELMRAHGY